MTRKLEDIKDMPDFNPLVKNGIDSVSTGKVYLNKNGHVYCKEHGAMNRLTKEGIYRCLSAVTMGKNDAVVNLCNEGAWCP